MWEPERLSSTKESISAASTAKALVHMLRTRPGQHFGPCDRGLQTVVTAVTGRGLLSPAFKQGKHTGKPAAFGHPHNTEAKTNRRRELCTTLRFRNGVLTNPWLRIQDRQCLMAWSCVTLLEPRTLRLSLPAELHLIEALAHCVALF